MLNSISGKSTRPRTWIASAAVISGSRACFVSFGHRTVPRARCLEDRFTIPAAGQRFQNRFHSFQQAARHSGPQIIQKFGDRELEFKKERDNYTYTQTFVVQTIDYDGRPDGEYRMISDILFTPEGKRYEKVISAPPPTLQRIMLSQQDLDDLEHVQPFVLTADELPKYDVNYARARTT